MRECVVLCTSGMRIAAGATHDCADMMQHLGGTEPLQLGKMPRAPRYRQCAMACGHHPHSISDACIGRGDSVVEPTTRIGAQRPASPPHHAPRCREPCLWPQHLRIEPFDMGCLLRTHAELCSTSLFRLALLRNK